MTTQTAAKTGTNVAIARAAYEAYVTKDRSALAGRIREPKLSPGGGSSPDRSTHAMLANASVSTVSVSETRYRAGSNSSIGLPSGSSI
jgi:hypothetical protein